MTNGHDGGGNGKKKPMTIDDLFPDEDIAKRLKAYDTHMATENQHKLFNEIFTPAIDEFYNMLKTQLDKTFKNDTTKVKDKLPDVRKALVEGLKKYFERAMPSALSAIKGVDDAEKQFDILAHIYDTHVLGAVPGARLPQGVKTIRQYVEDLKDDKDATVGQVKEELYLQKTAHAIQGRQQVNQLKQLEYVVPIPAHRLARHLQPEVDKTHTIEDDVRYATLGHGELLQIREGLKTGSWPQQTPGPKHYGLKAKEQQQHRQ